MKGRWKKGNMRILWENPLICTKYTAGKVIIIKIFNKVRELKFKYLLAET
jgi:hypothetical protein